MVMRLDRMGSFFPTRLSFMRSLIRRLHDEGARPERVVWEIDANGYGAAVYTVSLGGSPYSLVAFSTPLAQEDRSDRVIAEAWDTSYVLFDGVPSRQDIDRLRGNAPVQEAGRFHPSDLVLSRANKSVRLFEHVVERLARGLQPDRDLVASTGYLMRTTAVYGNGKFGIADRGRIADRPGLGGPFQAEMLTVWLIRGFTLDLVEHVAHERALALGGTVTLGGTGAARLDPALRRYFGIGNSTGLGMAPFLVNHPVLLNNWMTARETALARVRAQPRATDETAARFRTLLTRVRRHVEEWRVDDARQMARIATLRRDLDDLAGDLDVDWFARPMPWERLIERAETLSLECRELMVSLVLEPHGALVDDLTTTMISPGEPRLDPAMRLGRLLGIVETECDWALSIDFEDRDAAALFWYVSEEKLEPRLGQRWSEPGAERESPLDIARQIKAMHADLKQLVAQDGPGEGDLSDGRADQPIAGFLMRYPEHRNAARRLQILADHPYSEVRDNLIAADCLPIDLLRCKLSFFGAGRFDPKSDRWTRIVMFQGAPGLDEIGDVDPDDWCFPTLVSVADQPSDADPCTSP
jgi:hypothetical protein